MWKFLFSLLAPSPKQLGGYVSHVMTIGGAAAVASGHNALGSWLNAPDIAGGVSAFVGVLWAHYLHGDGNPPSPSGGGITGGRLAGLVLACGLLVGTLTGCGTRQIINHSSVQGGEATISVPNPLASGSSFIQASLKWGNIKDSFVDQPTGTNQLRAPSLAIADISKGNDSVNGGLGTNAAAGISAGSYDKYFLTSGDTVAEETTNRVRLDGYQGYNPHGTNN